MEMNLSELTDWLEELDYSQYDFPNEIWYMIPSKELAAKIATFSPVIIIGCIGNIMLISIILGNRALRTPTNYLIANSAVADFATVMISPIMFMYHDFYQNYHLGKWGCLTEGFLEGAFLITGVLNLCAVSYDRLTAIVLPMRPRLSIAYARLIMISTWLIGFGLSIPLAYFRKYRERRWRNFLETYCTENTNFLPTYWHVLISALVWFPLTVMIICYTLIFWKLDRYEREVLKREHPISVSYKKKVAKTLFIVLVIFIILRAPFTALIFMRNQMLRNSEMNQVEGSFHSLWYAAHYLIFLNAAVNPLIYGLTNDNFRRAYYQTSFYNKFFKSNEKSHKQEDVKKDRKKKNFVPIVHLEPREACPTDHPMNGARVMGNGWLMFSSNKNKMATSTTATKISDVKMLTTDITNDKLDGDNQQHTEKEAPVLGVVNNTTLEANLNAKGYI